jgi:hypothetical protein
MAFEPDILVTTPEGAELVVDAELALPDLERTETELKKYMVGMQYPLGLLITPERMWLYRDLYTSRSSDSVQRIGEFNLKPVWQQPPPLQETAFESFVQYWLEYLPNQPIQNLPNDLRQALREYILPAVRSGEVRAAHPRYA